VIRLVDISKTFSGVKALDRVSFDIFPGEVHALCGENGAGKTTLIQVLAGIFPYPTYEGRILRLPTDKDEQVEQVELRFRGVQEATAAGIAVVHQELALLPDMTVLENLFLGKEISHGGRLDKHAQRRRAEEHFGKLGFMPPLDAPVRELSVGRQQRLEIARSLLTTPSVLVLDEPTSALPEDDARSLLQWIRRLADNGTACIYISHRMAEVLSIADRITVLRDGRTVWTKLTSEVEPRDVITAMVDRPPTDRYAHTPLPPGELLCAVQKLRVTRGRRTILQVEKLLARRGEIVGLAGLMGAGRTCLLRCLIGELRQTQVTGTFRGREQTESALPKCAAEAMQHGLFLIPEDRKQQALFLEQPLVTNVTSANVGAFRHGPHMNRPAMRQATVTRLQQFAVKAPGPQTIARTLSGGNQQKLLLCRAAEVAPGLLLLDEPTRGIDVGAKEAIYRQMEAWTQDGWGIIWSSSELPELLGISDRIYVLANGRVTAEFRQRPFSEANIMAAATTS